MLLESLMPHTSLEQGMMPTPTSTTEAGPTAVVAEAYQSVLLQQSGSGQGVVW